MGNPRWKYLSDDDDEEAVPRPSYVGTQEPSDHRMRKKLKFMDEDDEEEEVGVKEVGHGITGDGDMVDQAENAKVIGDSIRVSGYGRTRRLHFKSFEYDGVTCKLEDHVLIVPETKLEKPNVVIIKDISQTVDGSVLVKGQRFFYPKQAVNGGGWNWQPCDPRELFFSFHLEEFPAEMIMHKCVVHYIPSNKQIPDRKQHPGFIVINVYDTKKKDLFELTDKSYEYSQQHEIDLLVLKTMSRLGELPDAEMQKRAYEYEERKKILLKKRNMAPPTVSSNDERTTGYDPRLKSATPGNVTSSESEYYKILSKFKARTGKTKRDQWLVKHLEGIHFIWSPQNNGGINATNDSRLKIGSGSGDNNNAATLRWPDVAVSAVIALERAVHEAHSSDFIKYNQKMRQLLYNLKNNSVLAQRMLKGELEPSKILKMSSTELKKGLTSEEIAIKEPEKAKPMQKQQMTDARCKRCKEKQVAIKQIITARNGDRYQMECLVCGHTWYGSQDEATPLSIDKEATQAGTVGTVPSATAKIGDVEKATKKPDIFRNSTQAYMPVMDTWKKSFDRK